MDRQLTITSDFIDTKELAEQLRAYQATDLLLKLTPRPPRFRNDPNILIALVGMAGTGLGALISGLLAVAGQRQAAFMELHGKEWSLRVPVGTDRRDLEELIELVKTKEVSHIHIIK